MFTKARTDLSSSRTSDARRIIFGVVGKRRNELNTQISLELNERSKQASKGLKIVLLHRIIANRHQCHGIVTSFDDEPKS